MGFDPTELEYARARLTHPARRLELELSWFPGVSPVRAKELANQIGTGSSSLQLSNGLSGLAQFNAYSYWLTSQTPNQRTWKHCLEVLVKLEAEFDREEMLSLINADRCAAGFPKIQDSRLLEQPLADQLAKSAEQVADALVGLEGCEYVLAEVVDEATEGGECQCGDFLYQVVDRYQLLMQSKLDKHRKSIEAIAISLRPAKGHPRPQSVIERVELLVLVIKKWDAVAQPVQLAMRSKGLPEEHSTEVGTLARSVAVSLANDYGFHKEAQQIIACLHNTFQEVRRVSERTEEDLDLLAVLIDNKQQEEVEAEQRRQEMTLHLVIGSDLLEITPQSISYQGRSLKTEQIGGVKWGIYKQYLNGIRVDRRFTVWVGGAHGEITIECVRFLESEEKVLERFITVIDKVWRTVGLRLLFQMANAVMAGAHIDFGDARLTKDGIWLPKRGWLSSGPYFGRWEELTKSTSDGCLSISSTREEAASASLSLRDVDNAVVLDRLLDFLWKEGNYAKLRDCVLFRQTEAN